jgi:hypothetical protein
MTKQGHGCSHKYLSRATRLHKSVIRTHQIFWKDICMRRVKSSSLSERLIDICTKSFSILLLASVFLLPASGQEQKSMPSQDTSTKRSLIYNSELFLAQPSLLPARSYEVTQESFSDFLHQSLSVPMPPFSWTFKTKNDLENSWRQELAKQNEYRTLRTVLGSIQMGGVAYLTYMHLKKYGLK